MNLYDVNGNVISAGSSSGTVTIENMGEIAAETVTEEINLMTVATWTEGVWINAKGVETQNAAYSSTGMIDVGEENSLRCAFTATNLKGQAHCYDAENEWLGFVETAYSTAGVDQVLALLDGTKYIRMTYAKATPTSGKMSIFLSSAVTYYDFIDTPTKKWTPLSKRAEVAEQFSAVDALLWNVRKWNGKSLVTDGNSLVDSTNWGDYLAGYLGMNHTNCGASGSNLVHGATTMDGIKALVADEFPNAADLVILQGDSNMQSLDGSVSDQMDGDNPVNSWCSRMNYLIRCIKAKYHNVVIVMIPDSVRYDNATEQYLLDKNRGVVETMKAIAEYNRINFWNFDGSTPYNPLHDDNYYSRLYGVGDVQDYIHPGNGTGVYTPGSGYFAEAKGYALAWWCAGLTFDPKASNIAATDWQNNV